MYVIVTMAPDYGMMLYGPYATHAIALDHLSTKISPALPHGYRFVIAFVHQWPEGK